MIELNLMALAIRTKSCNGCFRMKLKKIFPLFGNSSRQVSALYVSGDRATENYAILTPFMEFSNLLTEYSSLKANIALRQMELDLPSVLRKYEIYRKLENEKLVLEKRREEVANELRQLNGSNKDQEDTFYMDQIKTEGRELRSKLKMLKEQLYPIEYDFINEFLKLPNTLHDKASSNELSLLYRQGLPPARNAAKKINHLDRNDLIDFRDSSCYYLKKEAATFDFYLAINCVRRYLDNKYTQFVNPDFCRTILLEAAAIDLNAVELVHEDVKSSKVNLLHLTGGGSMTSFLGFITKLSIFPSLLPLRLISSGREYIAFNEKNSRGLYGAAQSNSVQIFIATKNQLDLEEEIENALGLAIDIFREFNIHFRIAYLPAKQLTAAESARACIQMYSPFYDEYIEVGYLSNYRDYLSKRLLFNFRNEGAYKFPHIAAGPIMKITNILACLLENEKDINNVPSSEVTKKDPVMNFTNLFT